LNTHLTPVLPLFADCRSGTFEYRAADATLQWSDSMYQIHGYERGDVVPTINLALSHVPMEERELAAGRWKKLTSQGGASTTLHSILDARAKKRQVLAVAETITSDGLVAVVRGRLVDLTDALGQATRVVTAEAVVRSHEHRACIEQAKGILMGHFRTDADTAFRILIRMSSTGNTKLHHVAETLVNRATAEGAERAVAASTGRLARMAMTDDRTAIQG
jgi:ANTAR domain